MYSSALRSLYALVYALLLVMGSSPSAIALDLERDVVVKPGDGCPEGYRELLYDELGSDWGPVCWDTLPAAGVDRARIHHLWQGSPILGVVDTRSGCQSGWGGEYAETHVSATLCVAASTGESSQNSTDSSNKSRNLSSIAQEWLDTHNAEREKLGIAPLVWDDGVAAVAQEWAEKLAQTQQPQHRRDSAKYRACPGECGENLAWASGYAAYSPSDATSGWLSESPDWDRQRGSTYCLNNRVCGHYTQVISKLSRKLGCAIVRGQAYSAGYKWYAVCNYHPHGNVTGVRIVP